MEVKMVNSQRQLEKIIVSLVKLIKFERMRVKERWKNNIVNDIDFE